MSIAPCEIPGGSFLEGHRLAGAYTDCYSTDIARAVSQAGYVEAFYTTPLFRLERVILGVVVKRPSTDADARALATGASDAFAAWHVENRSERELLVAAGRTRSWLMAAPSGSGTRLFFGSAIVPAIDPRTGKGSLGAAFHGLLGFHKLYSRALLRAARSRLERGA